MVLICTVVAFAILALNVRNHANTLDTVAPDSRNQISTNARRLDARGNTCTPAQASVAAAEPTNSTRREVIQYEAVLDYLGKADLLRFVNGPITSHGSGSSFGVMFKFVTDDESKAKILAVLRNRKIFDLGPRGPSHVKDVGATDRADAYDFRSINGTLGPRSLEVMINRGTLWGYADIDRFDLYGGFVPASAHILIEFLPHKVWSFFRNDTQREPSVCQS